MCIEIIVGHLGKGWPIAGLGPISRIVGRGTLGAGLCAVRPVRALMRAHDLTLRHCVKKYRARMGVDVTPDYRKLLSAVLESYDSCRSVGKLSNYNVIAILKFNVLFRVVQ